MVCISFFMWIRLVYNLPNRPSLLKGAFKKVERRGTCECCHSYLSAKSCVQLLYGVAALAPMLFGQAACSGSKLNQDHEIIRFLKPSCDQVSPASRAFPGMP